MDRSFYTVGILCALAIELQAVLATFDERPTQLRVPWADSRLPNQPYLLLR